MERRTKNKYMYPVEINDQVRISYNESPAHIGNLKYSVDFIIPKGTPVIAAMDGIVIDLKLNSNVGGADKELELFGNFIEIQHENDEYSEYEHLQIQKEVIVKLGQKVKKGDIIGRSGGTGYLAHLEPHLHFMVGKYGDTIDDYETLEIIWENKHYSQPIRKKS
ncbi:MAG: M23 family metallopeptidase [Patescibacteria group bacterium]